MCFLVDFRQWFVSSSFIGSIFVSFQQNADLTGIPHFSYKRRKLIGQNKVKFCKLQSQNLMFEKMVVLLIVCSLLQHL